MRCPVEEPGEVEEVSSSDSSVMVVEGEDPVASQEHGTPLLNVKEDYCARKRERSGSGSTAGTNSSTSSSAAANPTLPLSDEQQAVIDYVVKDRRSVFITGGAGTGKTFLLRAIIERLPKHDTFVTATTGIAALQLSGSTLHSFAGCGLVKPTERKEDVFKRVVRSRKSANKWKMCRVLIIDEISMLDGSFFEVLEYVARRIRGIPKPFGDIQLIFSGDFLQLPPVGREHANNTAPFCFETKSWIRCNPKVCELTLPFRQNDPVFFELLRDMRVGFLSLAGQATLQGRCTQANVLYAKEVLTVSDSLSDAKMEYELTDDRGVPLQTAFDGYTFLRPIKKDVERQNNRFYEALHSPEYFYVGFHEGEGRFPEKDLSSFLAFRIGCRVMLTKNLDVAAGLVNGSAGTVVDFFDFSGTSVPSEKFKKSDCSRLCIGSSKGGLRKGHCMLPIVAFELSGGKRANGTVAKKVVVEPAEWSREEGEVVVARSVQLPLIVAFAITVHKSQGMSLSKVDIDFSHSFEVGQAYVALSRCTSLGGTRLHGFSSSVLMVSDTALGYYQALKFLHEKDIYWAKLRGEMVGVHDEDEKGASRLPLPPCGYVCPPQLAEEDDPLREEDGLEDEWKNPFTQNNNSKRKRPYPCELVREEHIQQKESTQLDRLWRRIGPLIKLTKELKKLIQYKIKPIREIRNSRLVLDVESFFDMQCGDCSSVEYDECCEMQSNMLRVPRIVYDFFAHADALNDSSQLSSSFDDSICVEAMIDHNTENGYSSVTAHFADTFSSTSSTSFSTYRARPSQLRAAAQIRRKMETAKKRFVLDVQRPTEVAVCVPFVNEAWEKFLLLLPFFANGKDDALDSQKNVTGEEELQEQKMINEFVSFTLHRVPREGQHHRSILEYALYLRESCGNAGQQVVLCTGSFSLAASALALGFQVTSFTKNFCH